MSFTANSTSSSLNSSARTMGPNYFASNISSTIAANATFQQNSTDNGSFALNGYVSYTQAQQGTYAGGNYTLTDYSYAGLQSGNYGSVLTHLVRETLTANGNATHGDSGTFSSSYDRWDGSTHGGGFIPVTITDSHNNGETTTFSGTITAGETKVVSEAGTYSLAAQQHGGYSGASFAFDTMVYQDTVTSFATATNQHLSAYLLYQAGVVVLLN